MEQQQLPSIFEYLSYREYLGDYYTAAKKTIPAFSYRYFSRRAGFSSPNFLKLVIDGKRNLGSESVVRFARALELNKEERGFFKNLVDFEQASTPEEANAAYAKVAASKRFRTARRIDHHMFAYLSHWYYPAIRELAAREGFKDDPKWVARQLVPKIKKSEAKAALSVLFNLGLLVRKEDGTVVRGDTSLSTGHEVRALAVGNYHRQMLERAAESIALVPSEFRDVSALTVCIEADTVAEVKDRMQRFRETLLDRCDGDENPEHVYQINLQFFPLTTPPDGEE